jgi:hypothetical protein
MRAEWFNACISLVAYCKHSDASDETVAAFRNTLVRLMSMLNACALAELEEINCHPEAVEDITAFDFDLIDPLGIDMRSLVSLKDSDSKVELLFFWIQALLVENIRTGVLSIPAPILSRTFHQLGNGWIAFNDAIKVSYIAFPFPYAQTCEVVLALHWAVVPFVVVHWVTHPAWAFVFALIQVFILWALNFIAVEIENPFGKDANDLDGQHMQDEFNRHLMLLLQKETLRVPQLSERYVDCERVHADEVDYHSLACAWEEIPAEHKHVVCSARISNRFCRGEQPPKGSLLRGAKKCSTHSTSVPYRASKHSNNGISSGNSNSIRPPNRATVSAESHQRSIVSSDPLTEFPHGSLKLELEPDTLDAFSKPEQPRRPDEQPLCWHLPVSAPGRCLAVRLGDPAAASKVAT